MSFSVGIRLSVSSSQYLMSISCALQEAYAAMSAAASTASYYGSAAMSAASAEGSFTAGLTGLSAGTTYYYQAYVKVQGTGDKSSSVQTFTGDVNRFTTKAEEVGGLLELPARRDPFEASVGKVALVTDRWRGIRPLRRTGVL